MASATSTRSSSSTAARNSAASSSINAQRSCFTFSGTASVGASFVTSCWDSCACRTAATGSSLGVLISGSCHRPATVEALASHT